MIERQRIERAPVARMQNRDPLGGAEHQQREDRPGTG
jgi:hypothetical protein